MRGMHQCWSRQACVLKKNLRQPKYEDRIRHVVCYYDGRHSEDPGGEIFQR